MNRALFVLSFLSLLFPSTLAQRVGDQVTAGFGPGRTYLNSDMGNFGPPLIFKRTINLGGNPDAITIFEGKGLVAIGGDPAGYALIDLETGAPLWTVPAEGPVANLDYAGPFNNDIVLLGNPSTSAVSAVQVSTGVELWNEMNLGTPLGRYPLLSSQRAIFHGSARLVSAEPSSGLVFWEFADTAGGTPIETAVAPLASSSEQLYVIDREGTLYALALCSGEIVWSLGGAGGDGSDLLATAGMVFVTDPGTQLLRAVQAATGLVAWTRQMGEFASPGIALAYDQLLVFYQEDSSARISALNPETGDDIWQVSDGMGSPAHGLVANNYLFFYNTGSERIRILDVFNGTILDSISHEGVRGLSAANGLLYVLLERQIDIYERSDEIYLAQVADGGGASTLITLVNRQSVEAQGSVEFFDDAGQPLPLMVEGLPNAVSTVDFVIQANDSIKVQTLGLTDMATSGWAKVNSDRQIAGSSVYQFSEDDVILFEAGIGASQPTTRAQVFASRILKTPGNPFSTGIAIANPSDEDAEITIEFRRTVPTAATAAMTMSLGPQEHAARFLEELFQTGIADFGSEGTLVISSDMPIVIVALRTQRGFQMSSYPVAQ